MIANVCRSWFQRPTAKELLRHPFVKKAKRNNQLMDLIDRYRKWKLTHQNESDSDSDGSEGNDVDDADSDWDIGTIREPSAAAAAAASADHKHQNGGGGNHAAAEEENEREQSLPPSQPPSSSSSSFDDPPVTKLHVQGQRSSSPVKQRLEQHQSRHQNGGGSSSPLRDNWVARSEINLVRLCRNRKKKI